MHRPITALVEDGAIIRETSRAALVPWWSVSKSAIAAAALRLVEHGKLALDVPLSARGYTLRHLLLHRAGLRDYGSLPGLAQALDLLVFAPLGIGSRITDARTAVDVSGIAAGYDPGWVYHGLLVSHPADVALFMDRLLAGSLFGPALQRELLTEHGVPDAAVRRPWVAPAYSLGHYRCTHRWPPHGVDGLDGRVGW